MNRSIAPFRYLSLLAGILLFSCNSNPQIQDPIKEEQSPELSMKNPIVKREAKIFRKEVKYSVDSLKSRETIDSLLGNYNDDELKTVLAINRIEKNKIRPNRPLVIPECAAEEFNNYSPFPEDLQELHCIPKTVLINKRVQAFGLYENGELVKWGPVSTGKGSTQTPAGLNYGNYKAKRKVSTVDASWILPYYFNFMNFEGVGVHQYALPGYPASHGCVRLYMDDAKYIFDWASMWELENSDIEYNGTPFMVFGEYDHSANKPWLDLQQNMKANDLTQDELNTIREYVSDYQEDPKNYHNIASKTKDAELADA
ncbi:L,D-transpeptidase [Christiangramia marina]|uniref:L,D-transpeptidase n=1 Tax=Christiangramia marina TaxID=409436 RepID=UPI003AA8D4A4